MTQFIGTFYALYWHGESWLPRYLDITGEHHQRLFVHRDRYITMHDYTLLIPPRGSHALYRELGMILFNDERGVQLGIGEVVDVI